MITSVVRFMGAGPVSPSPSLPVSPSSAQGETKFSNGAKAKRNRYPQAGGTLSNKQKARLCLLARQAFEVVQARPPTDRHELDAWRHAQCEAAVGKPGLTACVQGDYQRLLGWFLDLAGEAGQAMNAHLAHETDPKRLALFKLKEACAARGLQLGYAAVICRRKFKRALEEADAPTLWKLVFELRGRKARPAAKPKKQAKPDDNEPF